MLSKVDVAKRVLERFLDRIFGKRTVTIAFLAFIAFSAASDFFGRTLKGWSYLEDFFQEKTSLLNTAELEVRDEWVVLIDIAHSFHQAEAYRRNLSTWSEKIDDKKVASHFSRNLRVVRDPHNAAYWLLVADINSGRSTREEVGATIECIKEKIADWEEDDIIAPWLDNSRAYDYDLDEFAKTYGRISNLPAGYEATDRSVEQPGRKRCPYPYSR